MTVAGTRVLVVGLGKSGSAASARLRATGHHVVVTDDRGGEALRASADALGVELVEGPDAATLRQLVSDSGLVVVSPGVPIKHPVFALATELDVPVLSEIELAARSLDCPLVAVTGTNGKTTVTSLVSDMLRLSGRRVLAAGNVGLPLTEAIGRELDVIVVEVSSFQLQLSPTFRPAVGVWLNLAEDHLDWHPTLLDYADAKARIWANQGPDDVAVANAEDLEVMGRTTGLEASVVTFGADLGDYCVVDGALRTPEGDHICAVTDLPRRLPHDLSNALAASAAALAAGGHLEGVRRALREFRGLPHRLSLVGESGGVRWYDDSKATNPHAALTAVRGFESVVLVAGGRNKGLDLSPLRQVAPQLRAVVAIGDAGAQVHSAIGPSVPVVAAPSMDEAVAAAAGLAQPGDVVLLSPACASFDWYSSYAERGDDFCRAVGDLLQAAP